MSKHPSDAFIFPPVEQALADPNGLLAVGGDLSSARLLAAYRRGIFPWFSPGDPILWWSPDPRMVLFPEEIKIRTSLARTLRNSAYEVRLDTAFDQVLQHCAETPRHGQRGTWITADMFAAYRELHRLGHAHSVEVYAGETLVGGLIGLAFGQMFCGDSMLSAHPGGSSLALAALANRLHDWGWPLIDAQVPNAHTQRLGVEIWSRERYLVALSRQRDLPGAPGQWTERFGSWSAAQILTAAATHTP